MHPTLHMSECKTHGLSGTQTAIPLLQWYNSSSYSGQRTSCAPLIEFVHSHAKKNKKISVVHASQRKNLSILLLKPVVVNWKAQVTTWSPQKTRHSDFTQGAALGVGIGPNDYQY
jgi:hypothetical protein